MRNGIVTNSILNAAAGMVILVTGFLSSIVIARLLGPEANGTIAFALWLVTTGSLVAELGTGVTLLRIMPQLKVRGFDTLRRRGFAASLLHPVIASTTLLVALYALFFWTAGRGYFSSSVPIVVLTGILLFLQSIGSYSKNYFIGEQDLGTFSRMTTVVSFIQLGAVIVGAVFAGLPGALAGYLAAQIVPFVAAIRISLTPRDDCGIDRRALVSSSLVLVVEFIVSAVFLTRPELFFLQHFQNVATVGFYAVALSLSNLALQLPIQLTGSLLPFYAQKQEEALGKLPQPVFAGVVRSLSYITLPMCFGLAAIAEPLVVLLYGEDFRASGAIVAILSVGAPLYVFLQICTQYLLSMDRARTRLVIAVFGSVVMVGAGLAVIPFWGAEGAAWVRNGVFAVMVACMVRSLKFEGGHPQFYSVVAGVALASVFCAGAAWIVCETVGGALGVALAVVAGGIAYFAGIRLLRVVPQEDALVLHHLFGSLPVALRRGAKRLLQLIVVHPLQSQPGE